MSFDLVEIIKEKDFKDTKLQLGLQCAPVIAGIKVSNLFTIQAKKVNELEKNLLFSSLSYVLLYEGDGRAVFLIYNKDALFHYLSLPEIELAWKKFGYSSCYFYEILPLFIYKYSDYMKNKKDFPHELGLLLGYPLADVLGFIQNKGKDFLYSGYWKVYEKKEEKVALFKEYEEVQIEIVSLLIEGREIEEIIAFYKALVKKYKYIRYRLLEVTGKDEKWQKLV